MLKIFSVLLVIATIFEAQSASSKKKKPEGAPAVFYSKLTKYHIKPNNNVVEEVEAEDEESQVNGLLQWQNKVQEGENGIQIYSVVDGEKYELEDLCVKKPQTIFPTMVQRFLGIDSCPIEKGTLSLLTNVYTRTLRLRKNDCDESQKITLLLWCKKQKKDIMTLNIVTKDLRLDECK